MFHLKHLGLLGLLLLLTACSPSPTKPTAVPSGYKHDQATTAVLDNAYSFLGTPYRYGGNTRSGIDCSGLVVGVYSPLGIQLPRTSIQQSQSGQTISRGNAQPGDLIFFRTSGSQIGHVGIINQVNGHEIKFIHASESKGVIISSSENSYWKRRFKKVVRVLP